MITILVLDDEKKIYNILSQVLKKEGYSVLNEPETEGLIKIVRRRDRKDEDNFSRRILDLKDILLREKNGEIYKALLAEVEKPLIESVLERTEGNQIKAAKALGINRNTLRAKIKKLNISTDRWKR